MNKTKAAKQTLNQTKSKLAPPSQMRLQWPAAWPCVWQTTQSQAQCALVKAATLLPTGLKAQKYQEN
jgi:hypothetical protein